ncbi:MAG: winged helix-turn-helix domain-containing protein [Candidatus Bipolaricaulota bacterium]
MTVDDIGFAAGRVWRYLLECQPVALSRIAREVEGGQTLVLMAVGWLAREGKVEFVEEGRVRLVRLRD